MELRVTPWTESAPPSEATLRDLLRREGLDYYAWSNGPNDFYAPHAHAYDKVIYVARGSITFAVRTQRNIANSHDLAETAVSLRPGDRLDLPAGIVHAAHVGEQGVTCLEAHC